VNVTGRVLAADGSPLAAAKVDVVSVTGTKVTSIGRGTVKAGALSATAKDVPVWALRIDGQPVIAIVVSFDGTTADVGEIVLASQPTTWPAFHSPDGLIFGAPRAAAPVQPLRAVVAPTATTGTAVGIGTRGGLTFGGLLGSAAQQLNSVVSAAEGVQLTSANITIKGLPTATDDALALEFPTAELAAAGTGLSELSFTVKPGAPVGAGTPQPSGPALPDVGGYTRDLAVRKLAALNLVADVRDEITADRTRVGRVLRQIPAAGQPVASAHVVQIYIGRLGA
jgi:hypothetical protein